MYTEEYFMEKQIDLELEQLAIQIKQIELRKALLLQNKKMLSVRLPDEGSDMPPMSKNKKANA